MDKPQMFVWGVFGADGCECDSLCKLFSTESAAEEFLNRIKAEATHVEGKHGFSYHDEIYGDPKYADIRKLEVLERAVTNG